MSRTTAQRIAELRGAIARCPWYADHLDAPDGYVAKMAADAIERNIIVVVVVVVEATDHLPATVTEELPGFDWPTIRGMQNILIHEHSGVDRAIVRDVIETELRALDAALVKSADHSERCVRSSTEYAQMQTSRLQCNASSWRARAGSLVGVCAEGDLQRAGE